MIAGLYSTLPVEESCEPTTCLNFKANTVEIALHNALARRRKRHTDSDEEKSRDHETSQVFS